MFQLESINVPVLGLVENMAYFTPPDLPDRKYHLFGRDGVEAAMWKLRARRSRELPLVQAIREAGDAGRPAALQEGTEAALAIAAVADRMLEELERRPDVNSQHGTSPSGPRACASASTAPWMNCAVSPFRWRGHHGDGRQGRPDRGGELQGPAPIVPKRP